MDSPVDTDDITVQVPPPVPVSNCSVKITRTSGQEGRDGTSTEWLRERDETVTAHSVFPTCICDFCAVITIRYSLKRTVASV